MMPAGEARLQADEALALLEGGDLLDLGRRADALGRRLHPEPIRTFAIDRNINFTNVCTCRCLFCAFWRPPDAPDAYVLGADTLHAKVREAADLGATHVLLQGGLNPRLDLEWHERMLRGLKERFDVTLHCYSPPEVRDLARRAGLSVRQVLERLRAAGLDSLPGGGAEILVDRVRRLVSPEKGSAADWLDVMRTAHGLGLPTTATMVFGHVETPAERVEHLARIRDLQDATGGFQSFIPWPFRPGWTRLAESGLLPPDWHPVAGVEYLRMVAVARLFLDNVPNLQASWVTMGPAVGQVALGFGANDLGSTMIEENVVAAAGCVHRLGAEALRRMIRTAGFEPHRRDCHYHLIAD